MFRYQEVIAAWRSGWVFTPVKIWRHKIFFRVFLFSTGFS